jgi:ATP-dependent protease HslVU (ClpYQ) peptidase subunit
MTTILACAKAGVIVCDSKCTSDTVWYPMTKVHRIGKELIGLAGSVKECIAWLEWYRSGKKGVRPKLESFQGLLLGADGLVQPVERGYHGIGSGGGYALAAYIALNDRTAEAARRSVEVACLIDNGSGGDVIVHALKG